MIDFKNEPGGPGTRDEFARLMAEAYRDAGIHGPVKYVKEDFRLIYHRSGSTVAENLCDAYEEYCASSCTVREQLLREWAHKMRYPDSIPDSWDAVRQDILPEVVTRSSVTREMLMVRSGPGPDDEMMMQQLADHLAVTLIDLKRDGISVLTTTHLEHWGVSVDEAMAVALENFDALVRPPFVTVQPGLHVSEHQDYFTATHILHADVIGALDVKGNPIAMLLEHDVVMVTGADDESGLGQMARFVQARFHEPRFMSGIPIRWDGRAWRTFRPDPEHRHYGMFRELYLNTLATEYRNQQDLLGRLYPGVNVPGVLMTGKSGEEQQLLCAWDIGSPAILPRVDCIGFISASDGGFCLRGPVPWERVETVCGHLLTPLGLYPECYLAATAPLSEQIEAELQ